MDVTSDDTLEYEKMIQAKDHIEKTKKTIPLNPVIAKSVEIVRQFICDTKSICYGGTAINNILPKSAQFYEKSEVPDYDFYHYNALHLAKQLADKLHKNGFVAVAKAGVHINTYKVYANFVPLADITQCDRPLYNELLRRAIQKKGMLYADPNFLRMAMYLELSRPEGDIRRWEKVTERLHLLNRHYPLSTQCKVADSAELDASFSETCSYIWDTCVQEKVVFLGGILSRIESFEEKEREEAVDGFHMNPLPVVQQIQKHTQGTIVHHPPVGEIVPACVELQVRKTPVLRLFQTIACHNYNEISVRRKRIRVATIDTIMNMYLALSYASSYSKPQQQRYLCMAQFIFEKYQQHRRNPTGVYNRFTLSCLGKQQTMLDILKTKYEIYQEMQKNATFRKKYDEYFLNYNPAIPRPHRSATRTRKKGVSPKKGLARSGFLSGSRSRSRSTRKTQIQSYLEKLKSSSA
jgi:hypothetical protein